MKYKAVIFDLDGTILDTLEDLADSLNYVLRMNGFEERTIDETRRFVGNGIHKLIERALFEPAAGQAATGEGLPQAVKTAASGECPQAAKTATTGECPQAAKTAASGTFSQMEAASGKKASPADVERIFADFKVRYGEHCADKTKPYEGIDQLLAKLREKGLPTAVVSNKADFAVKSLCETYFPKMFDLAVGEREGIRRKPCPDSLWEILRLFGVKPQEALYVGDSDVDIETAKNAGTDCLIVDWGFRSREELTKCGAGKIVSAPEEIYSYVMGETKE